MQWIVQFLNTNGEVKMRIRKQKLTKTLKKKKTK